MSFIINPYAFGSAAAPTVLLTEDFEGPGATGWTVNGWNDFYTLDPEFFAGDYGCEIDSATIAVYAYKGFTASSNVYCRFYVSATRFTTGAGALATIRTSTGTTLATFGIAGSTNAARSNAGGSTISSTTGPTINTINYGWFEYEKGTGSNAICRVGYTDTAARPSWPGSGVSGKLAVSINGTSTANAARIYFGSSTSATNYNVIIDNIEVRSTPFA